MHDIYRAPSQEQFSKRRANLLAKLQDSSVAVIANAPIRQRNADCNYTYRPDSSFYYLTGLADPESIAVFIKSGGKSQYILFCRDKDLVRDVWEGPSTDATAALRDYAADTAYPLSKFAAFISEQINSADNLYYPLHAQAHLDRQLQLLLQPAKSPAHRQLQRPCQIVDLHKILASLRMQKDASELALMQQAADISVDAHAVGMRFVKPGMFEWELAARIEYAMARAGALNTAYDSIVAAGANACVLHYTRLQSQIKSEDLVLVDAGCEYGLYASDITRTYPASGKFTGAGRDLYAAVLEVQQNAIAALHDKINNLNDFQLFTIREITTKLCDLGILSGHIEDLIASGAYREFYPHGVGHPIGLDVHDIQDLSHSAYNLEPGVMITVEPGIYIPESANVDSKWHGLGVRIEDDVHMTKSGPEVLTDKLAKTIPDIEDLMQSRDEI